MFLSNIFLSYSKKICKKTLAKKYSIWFTSFVERKLCLFLFLGGIKMVYKKKEVNITTNTNSDRTTMNVSRSTLNALNGLTESLRDFVPFRLTQGAMFDIAIATTYRVFGFNLPILATPTKAIIEDIPLGILNADYITEFGDDVLAAIERLKGTVEGINDAAKDARATAESNAAADAAIAADAAKKAKKAKKATKK